MEKTLFMFKTHREMKYEKREEEKVKCYLSLVEFLSLTLQLPFCMLSTDWKMIYSESKMADNYRDKRARASPQHLHQFRLT
jgi:hypothetical protein